MRKLPVFGVLSHALRSVINNIRFAWHVSWPWLAFLVPLGLAADFLLPRMDPQAMAKPRWAIWRSAPFPCWFSRQLP
jgi:hypothetical protein